jgi:hypothetical protein
MIMRIPHMYLKFKKSAKTCLVFKYIAELSQFKSKQVMEVMWTNYGHAIKSADLQV